MTRLLDARDDKGFKGFSRAPFGWPDELVRLVLAACFRAGAVYLAQQSAAGPTTLYDYKGADDIFSKITSFKKATFSIADAFVQTYDEVRRVAEATVAAVYDSDAFEKAPAVQREAVVDKVFGQGRVCHYPQLTLSSVESLLDAAGKRSLTALEQALVALPAYRSQVESELAALVLPPPSPDQKVFEWRPGSVLAGRRFATEADVEAALDTVSQELKARVREGFTVVVK